VNPYLLDNQPLTPALLRDLACSDARFALAPAALDRLARDRRVVEAHIAGGAPVYGLNTGLGGNLGYRLQEDEVQAYQAQIIQGRMIGMGEPMAAEVVRTALLVRVAALARGGSGVSVDAAQALAALLDRGVTPVVPSRGSIGAGDLGLSAHLMAPLLGLGEAFFEGERLTGAEALARAGLQPVRLQAKDGLGLINASPLTAGHAALVVCMLEETLTVAMGVAALCDEGYAANPTVMDPRISALRPAGLQQEVAAAFRALLAGSSLYDGTPRAIQDAISFRTMAQVFGSSQAAALQLHEAVQVEINGSSDNPVVLSDQEMLSSPNFHPPALALAFDTMAIAVVHLASASVQRAIKLMTPHLSGLPKYLSPVGGASVGFNALQKTAAALYAEIRLHATPASLDAVVVSDTVEDHATQALLCVRKLEDQLQLYRLLLGIEAMVAAQAVHLRGPRALGAGSEQVLRAVRAVVPPLQEDRPPGADAQRISESLFAGPLAAALSPMVVMRA
jgi:histidine ammonia-lyase